MAEQYQPSTDPSHSLSSQLDRFTQEQLKASMDGLLERAETHADMFGADAPKGFLPGSDYQGGVLTSSARDIAESTISDYAADTVSEYMEREIDDLVRGKMQEKLTDELVEKLFDETVDNETLRDFAEDALQNAADMEDLSVSAKRLARVAGMIHEATEAFAEHTNLLGRDDVNPNIADAVAAASYNQYLKTEVGVGLENHFEVGRELFDGPHDDLYNLMLHHTSRLESNADRKGYFERMSDLAERHFGDSRPNAPALLEDTRIVSDKTAHSSSADKLSALEDAAQGNGRFNPHGDGYLYLGEDGRPVVGPEEAALQAREAAEAARLDDLPPIQREVELGVPPGGTVSLSPQEAVEQIERDLPEALSDMDPNHGFFRHMSEPSTLNGVRHLADELDAAGVDSLDVSVWPDMTAIDRTSQCYCSIGDAAQAYDCHSFSSVERAVERDFHAAEPERFESYRLDLQRQDLHEQFPDAEVDAVVDAGL